MAATAHKRETHADLAREVERLRLRVAELEASERQRQSAESPNGNGHLREATHARRDWAEDVLGVLGVAGADVLTVLEEITVRAARLTGSPRAYVFVRDGGDSRDRLRLASQYNERFAPEWVFASDGQQVFRRPLAPRAAAREPADPGFQPILTSPMRAGRGQVIERGWAAGCAVLERRTIHLPDILDVPPGQFETSRSRARADGWRTVLVAPLLRGDEAIGVVTVNQDEPRPYGADQVRVLESFAAQAAVAIENARLFSELQRKNASLTEALGQQTASAEVLRVIASSPANLGAVLDKITATAPAVCGASDAVIWRTDGAVRWCASISGPHWGSHTGTSVERPPSARPLDRRMIFGHAMLDRRTIHLSDIQGPEGDAYPGDQRLASDRLGHRTMLVVPLLREGRALGALGVGRQEVAPFTDHEIALLGSFADQASIAIENARLFSELRERDERRRQELERASAIQRRLLPERVEGWPGVLEVAVRFRPAVETSGDFYDVLPLPARQKGALEPLQIAVGDVAGKGMSAALVTALARSALHASASVPPGMATPAATLRVAGQRLHRDVGSGHFVACALAVVEPPGYLSRGPLLRLSNAAQVPVLLARDGATSPVEAPGDRLPLGARPDGAYKDAEVELRPGDVVIFSSDGLIDAPALPDAAAPSHLAPPDNPRELFGFARLAASAAHWPHHAASAEEVAAGIWSDLTAWCGDQPHHDDMTLLVLRVPA